MALESFPPLMLVSVRYLASGAIMLIGAKITGAHLPRGKELRETALYGVIALGIGNGCLAFAEQWIPSGLAALFVTTSPFWLVGVEALSPGGERLHLPTYRGNAGGTRRRRHAGRTGSDDLSLHSTTLGAFPAFADRMRGLVDRIDPATPPARRVRIRS
jgi:hypothetical protein